MMPACTGPDRHLEHALAGHRPERMEVPGDARHDAIVGKVLAERPRAVRPIVVKRDARRIRMALGDEAEEIHDLAFEPVRRRILRRDRRDTTAWPDRPAPRCGETSRCCGSDQTWCRTKRPVAWRSSLREQRHQPSTQVAHDAIGQRRQRGRRRPRAISSPGTQLADGPIGDAERRSDGRSCRMSCAPPHDLRRGVDQRQQRRGQVERGHDRHDRRDDRRGHAEIEALGQRHAPIRSGRAAGRARSGRPDTRSRRTARPARRGRSTSPSRAGRGSRP